MINRLAEKRSFLVRHGWENAISEPMAGDASFRRYERLERDGARVILMDAPPPMENVRPYIQIARHLLNLGYSAPEIYAIDEPNGFLLIEDFGDDTYASLLQQGADEAELYCVATDVLIDLHAKGAKAIPSGVPLYDDERLLDEAALLIDWYYPEAMGRSISPELATEYRALWAKLLPKARSVPSTLVLRDFHVGNLMRLPRPGVKACGLLDFQDAVVGPISYDLISLLEDARRFIPATLVSDMYQRYIQAFPGIDSTGFDQSCAFMAAQRHAKVIGIFTRLYRRDGKTGYLRHIPHIWNLLERALAYPLLAELQDWFDKNLPHDMRLEPKA